MAADPRRSRTKALKATAQTTTTKSRPDGDVSVSLPPATVKVLDKWARRSGVSRSQAARVLIETALRRFEGYALIEGPE
jgi:hypothetical protein